MPEHLARQYIANHLYNHVIRRWDKSFLSVYPNACFLKGDVYEW